ncbi:MAG TPA: ATPase [Firmicutes bacterium]|nr:ATPase [Bacillota bacterium]
MEEKIFVREKYLKGIRPFYQSDIVKVITGIRRCGKSCLLKSIMTEMKRSGIPDERIIYLPLDRRGFKDIKTPKELEDRIESYIKEDGRYFLFIDEVQNVSGFESVVLSYQEEGYSIFLTGSNSYLLSDEISTKLTGRYLTFETFPLDFKEYVEMKRFLGKTTNDDVDTEFNEYILNGGFPKSLEFDLLSARQFYTREIVQEIFKKDVTSKNRVTNVPVFKRVQNFVIDNYASEMTVSNIVDELSKSGIKTKAATVGKYIRHLENAKIIYECNRFDLKSKKSLRKESKYYLTDLSLYFSLSTDNQLNYGPSLENIVYLYLISNGYQVSVGKIGNFECDFIIRKENREYAYIQVTYTLQGEDAKATNRIKEREYRPFRYIRNGYPRYIISLDRYRDQQEGVKHINAIDLMLGKENLI